MKSLIEKRYHLGNDLSAITGVVEIAVVEEARPFLSDIFSFETALYEAVCNAVEHGNLGISFEEKRRAMNGGVYDELLALRRATPPYSGRTVEVHLSITGDQITITLRDQGHGFDWQGFLAAQDLGQKEEAHASGRGCLIMTSVFDEIRRDMNESSVVLIKKRSNQHGR